MKRTYLRVILFCLALSVSLHLGLYHVIKSFFVDDAIEVSLIPKCPTGYAWNDLLKNCVDNTYDVGQAVYDIEPRTKKDK